VVLITISPMQAKLRIFATKVKVEVGGTCKEKRSPRESVLRPPHFKFYLKAAVRVRVAFLPFLACFSSTTT